ncbi:MAG: ABC transporter ATP-binding protein [Candidatus Lokiarchaeota archaeon]|nr:ABC transporter ATP-binding protein [Candidatus Harpocratesius repetitus]
MNSNDVVIELQHLTKNFGKFTAVKNISLEIHRGECLGFLGPNGAGKSTTMKMIAYLLRPSKGIIKIRTDGQLKSLNGQNKDRLLEHVGFLIENPRFYKNSTPRQILTYFAKLKGYPRQQIKSRVEQIVSMMGLNKWIDEKLHKFSKGMRQKVGILSAIVHDPDILIFDEPYTGLDPAVRIEVRDFILKLKEMGKTVFLSSHLLYEISEVADRIAIISHGRIIACDTLENLEQQAQSSKIHLEVLNAKEIGSSLITKLYEILQNYIAANSISYYDDGSYYTIKFDGNPNKQHQILKLLIENDIKVLEFSVPKAGLLESLYLDYISKSEDQALQEQKTAIKVEAIL